MMHVILVSCVADHMLRGYIMLVCPDHHLGSRSPGVLVKSRSCSMNSSRKIEDEGARMERWAS